MGFFASHMHKVKQHRAGKRRKYPRLPKRAKFQAFRRWLYRTNMGVDQ